LTGCGREARDDLRQSVQQIASISSERRLRSRLSSKSGSSAMAFSVSW